MIKDYYKTTCPCCGQPVIKFNRDLICTNEYGCQAIYESKLSNIIDKLEIKNIGPAIIHNFVNCMKENKLEYTFYNLFNILLLPTLGLPIIRVFIPSFISLPFCASLNILLSSVVIFFILIFNISFVTTNISSYSG